jgi:hypothetical protein
MRGWNFSPDPSENLTRITIRRFFARHAITRKKDAHAGEEDRPDILKQAPGVPGQAKQLRRFINFNVAPKTGTMDFFAVHESKLGTDAATTIA